MVGGFRDVPSRTWTGGIDQVIEVDASIVDRMDILLGNVQQCIRCAIF
jgi:hypothetical protein